MNNLRRCEIYVELEPGIQHVWKLSIRAMEEFENSVKSLTGKDEGYLALTARMGTWKTLEWTCYLWAGLYTADKAIEFEKLRDLTTAEVLQQFVIDSLEMQSEIAPRQMKKKVAELKEKSLALEPETSSDSPSPVA